MPGTLSGGEQQRVALARGLAVDPLFLLVDEPFAGLDLATKAEVLGDVKQLMSARGVTVCLVTHDPTEAFTLCTHGVVLDDGRVSESGAWDEILRAPRSALLTAFRASYRDASPR
jgi:molybdate transport system ATP-binding protein